MTFWPRIDGWMDGRSSRASCGHAWLFSSPATAQQKRITVTAQQQRQLQACKGEERLAFACNGKGRVARQKAPATAPAAPAAAATSMQTTCIARLLLKPLLLLQQPAGAIACNQMCSLVKGNSNRHRGQIWSNSSFSPKIKIHHQVADCG